MGRLRRSLAWAEASRTQFMEERDEWMRRCEEANDAYIEVSAERDSAIRERDEAHRRLAARSTHDSRPRAA